MHVKSKKRKFGNNVETKNPYALSALHTYIYPLM